MDKKQLRQEMKNKLALLGKADYEDKSYLIAQNLYQDQDWTLAKTVGITISNPPEVDTYQIIRKAWELGKIIVVPKCDPVERKLQFRKLERFSQLESVFFGLYEPVEASTLPVMANEIDLVIVPGLAFNENGYRLGFGGGYYDRFLKNFRGKKISLAFQSQIVEFLPLESHDIPVSKIITETEVRKTND